jgi:uncharacterized protein YeaO (DUF488 family)
LRSRGETGDVSMATITIKRVYDPPASKDGQRILVDRLWPRGLRKEAAALDLWAKELAPTTPLRQWFDHRPDRFTEFKRRYRDELKKNPVVADTLHHIGKARATLLYGAKDPAINHAVVLAAFLNKIATGPSKPLPASAIPAPKPKSSR